MAAGNNADNKSEKKKKNKSITAHKPALRQCAACGERKEKKDLIRIVRTPQMSIEADSTGRKNGRGVYICNSEQCLARAVKNHLIDKALGVQVDSELYEELKKEISSG